MIRHEDKLCKRQRIQERVTESLGGEEFSKYFQKNKTKSSQLGVPLDDKPSEINIPIPAAFDKDGGEPGLKVVSLHDSSGIIAVTEVMEKDAEKVVAQGWRDRYSLKPQGTTPLASLIAKGNQELPKSMRTPLQRIGANAMQKSGQTPHKNMPSLLQGAEMPSDSSVPLLTSGSNIDPFPAEVENTSPKTIDERKAKQTGNASTFLFSNFLYTQS